MLPSTIAEFVTLKTAERFGELKPAIKIAADDPGDPKRVHALRVAIRRALECLRRFDQFFDSSDAKKTRRRLKKVADACGATRNYDVVLDLLRAAGFGRGRIADHLKKERHKRQLDMEESLEGWRRSLIRHWKDAVDHPASSGIWVGSQSVEHNARRVLPKLAQELFAAGSDATAHKGDYERLHHFRILTKHFRYTLELFESAYGGELAKGVALVRELQVQLGKINDYVTALELVKGHARAEAVFRRALISRERRLRRYWSTKFDAAARTWWKSWLGR